MRVLVTTFPALGHFHAVAPLALALKAAGHDVCVATAPDLLPWVLSCGLPARAVGPLVRTLVTRSARHRATAAGPTSDPARDVVERAWPEAVAADLVRLAEEWRPSVVVHEEGEYAGVLAAARLGVPCVTQSWATPAQPRSARATAAADLEPLWAELASGETPRVIGQLYLDSCPPALQHNGIGGLERVVPVQAVPFDGPPSRSPGWLRELSRPAAYVTLGAQPDTSTPELLATLARGAHAAGTSVVVTTGPHDVSTLGSLPDGVHASTYLPQSHVFPNIDVVISHGGAGGTIGALRHALPHLVVPGRSVAQQGVAAVTAGIGTGLRLPGDRRTEADVRDAVRELLGDVRFELAASRVRDQIERLPTPEDAADLVTALAG